MGLKKMPDHGSYIDLTKLEVQEKHILENLSSHDLREHAKIAASAVVNKNKTHIICTLGPVSRDVQIIEKMLKASGVELKGDEKDQTGKPLLKTVMRKWLPVGDAILQMIVVHLPSPVAAQRYRVETLYDGPLDDAAFFAAQSTNPTHFVVTTSFTTYITRPVDPLVVPYLVSTGKVTTASKSLIIAESDVTQPDGVEVGRGSGTFMPHPKFLLEKIPRYSDDAAFPFVDDEDAPLA